MRKILLALFMMLMAAETFAYDFEVDGIYYKKLSDSVSVMVTSGSAKYSGAVTIPPSVVNNGKTYSVTAIGFETFDGCWGLTSVTIPNSVTSIGSYAFDSTGLTSITIPNSVTTIGWRAFSRCSGLTSISIPDCITTIEDDTFRDCSSLTSITIPNSVTKIGVEAFHGCSSLTSITLPNSVTMIGREAFSGCSGLTSIVIPNSVTTIEYGILAG